MNIGGSVIRADMLETATRAATPTIWRNWSGSVVAHPGRFARPQTEAELAGIVAHARKLRVVGSGHSFMPLCETGDVLVSLDHMPGALDVAADRRTVVAPAGWTLARLTEALWDEGLALANQGDINHQTLAGALATGTHGTGADLPCLSALARGFRLMLVDGSVVECGPDLRPDLFEAARLSLGLVGIALQVRIEVAPAYHLEERIEKKPLEEVWERFPEWASENRHAEFFIFPHADKAIVKTLHPAPEEGRFRPPGPVDETVFRLACELGAAAPGWVPTLQKLMTRGSGSSRRVGPAWRVFPSERTVPFEEMEYELPRTAGLPVLREALDWIRRRELPVAFPFEFRWTAGDDLWLSPFNRGPCASVSMHQYAGMPWRGLFQEGEAVFRAAGGRPHWGKRHTLDRAMVRDLYPDAERFEAIRRAHDPEAKFLNAHLAELFG